MSPPMGAARAGIAGAKVSEIPDGGVFRHTLNDASDTSTAADAWNDNDGTIQGATYTTDSFEGSHALSFDGADDYVELPDSPRSGAFTVSFRVYHDDTNSHGYIEDRIGAESNTGFAWEYDSDDGNMRFLVDNAGDLEFSYSPVTGAYTLLVAGADDTDIKVWEEDATVLASASSNGTPSNSPDFLQYGRSALSAGTMRYLTGDMDVVDCYDKLLSDAEVSSLYNTGSI